MRRAGFRYTMEAGGALTGRLRSGPMLGIHRQERRARFEHSQPAVLAAARSSVLVRIEEEENPLRVMLLRELVEDYEAVLDGFNLPVL